MSPQPTVTPSLSDSSYSSPPASSTDPSSPVNLPDYDVATAKDPANSVDGIADTLNRASLKLCNGPELTDAEKLEVRQALSEGVKVGLSHGVQQLCVVQDLKDHLKVLNLFDRLRRAVEDGVEYFDYPTCQRDDMHVDEGGVDAPPPPYAPNVEVPPATADSKQEPNHKKAEEVRLLTEKVNAKLLKDRRWEIYLNRAAYRLELWLAKILQPEYKSRRRPAFSEKESEDMPDHILPPIDVALMLHAYHLNPLFKREDSVRLRNRDGLSLFHFPLRKLAQRVHPTLPLFIDVDAARAHWAVKLAETRTKQAWDLPLQPPTGLPTKVQEIKGGSIFGLRVGCPRCRAIKYVPWTGVGKENFEMGMGEYGWQRVCLSEGCSQIISAEHLQMRRFLDDFAKWRVSSGRNVRDPATGLSTAAFFMAGTMMNPFTGELNTKDLVGEMLLFPIFQSERKQPATRYLVRKAKNESDLVDIDSQAAACGYHLPTFRQWFEERTFGPLVLPRVHSGDGLDQLKARIALMMRPYDHGNASAYGEGLYDLVAAVKRQSSFNDEMAKLGWSTHLDLVDRGALDDLLSRSLIRYHKYLDLLSLYFHMLSPTLDIDLCWHTHMLKQSYTQDTINFVGRFVNHDDAVETGVLKESFDRTSLLWKEKYGQPYSLCGCIYNNPGTIKKLKSLLGSGKSEEVGQENTGNSRWTSKMKGKWRAAKDLPGDKDQSETTVWQDATHPSAHSAVVVKEEEHKHDKLKADMLKDWSLGRRREGHESAFVFQHNTPGLHPYTHVPLKSSHYVSRGSSGDATINAYTLYASYGLMTLGTSAGITALAFSGAGSWGGAGAFGGVAFDCGGAGGGGCGGGGGC